MQALVLRPDAAPEVQDVDSSDLDAIIALVGVPEIGFATFGRRFAAFFDDYGLMREGAKRNLLAEKVVEYPELRGTVILFGLEQGSGDTEPISESFVDHTMRTYAEMGS